MRAAFSEATNLTAEGKEANTPQTQTSNGEADAEQELKYRIWEMQRVLSLNGRALDPAALPQCQPDISVKWPVSPDHFARHCQGSERSACKCQNVNQVVATVSDSAD